MPRPCILCGKVPERTNVEWPDAMVDGFSGPMDPACRNASGKFANGGASPELGNRIDQVLAAHRHAPAVARLRRRSQEAEDARVQKLRDALEQGEGESKDAWAARKAAIKARVIPESEVIPPPGRFPWARSA